MRLKKGDTPFVLASSSPRRRELLSRVGLKFEVFPAEVEEVSVSEQEPGTESIRIALEKAEWVAARLPPGRWVLAADTIVIIDGEILGKPRDKREARKMLRKISGRRHRVITSWLIMKSPTQVVRKGYVESGVMIKKLDEGAIEAYVDTGEPMDKAGAYAVQGIGAFMVKAIEGSWTNVVGLPLCEVIEALEEVGAVRMFSDD